MNQKSFKISLLSLLLISFWACDNRPKGGASGKEKDTSNTATVEMSNAPLEFAVYLESSGSMFPYSVAGSDFKEAIYDIITRIPDNHSPKHSLQFITDKAYPFKGNLADFIKNPDPFTAVKKDKTIKTGSSKLDEILKTAVNTAATGKISLLISDCIYSTGKTNSATALDQLKFLTKDLFKPKAKNMDILVWQLNSDFDGTYYDYLDAKHPYKGKRPYYMILIGERTKLNALLFKQDYQELQDFKSLAGFQNYAHFTFLDSKTTPFFSILPTTNKEGTFRNNPDKSDKKYIRGLQNAAVNRRNGKATFKIAIAIDLNAIYADDDYKTNPDNYDITANDEFQIVDITPLAAAKITKNDERYQGSATHLMTLTTSALTTSEQTLKIALKSNLPDWIAAANTDDDRSQTGNFKTKTFGLQHLMEGIHEAYHPVGNQGYFCTISLPIEK